MVGAERGASRSADIPNENLPLRQLVRAVLCSKDEATIWKFDDLLANVRKERMGVAVKQLHDCLQREHRDKKNEALWKYDQASRTVSCLQRCFLGSALSRGSNSASEKTAAAAAVAAAAQAAVMKAAAADQTAIDATAAVQASTPGAAPPPPPPPTVLNSSSASAAATGAYASDDEAPAAAAAASGAPGAPSALHGACCLHDLPCFSACVRPECCFGDAALQRRSSLQPHPYFFGAVGGQVCGMCATRIQSTREAVRAVSLGHELRPLTSVTAFPPDCAAALEVDIRTYQPRVMCDGSGDATSESVCAVCVRVLDDSGGGGGAAVVRCGGHPGSDTPCGLVYHLDCLHRVGASSFGAAGGAPACPFCTHYRLLDDKQRSRMCVSLHCVSASLLRACSGATTAERCALTLTRACACAA